MKPRFKFKREEGSTYITDTLVALNILAFIAILVVPKALQMQAFETFAFSAKSFLSGSYWTPITSMFLHGSLAHLIVNMISLFFFGRALELEISKGKYISLYLVGGVIATFFAAFFQPAAQASVGASGAIFAVIAAAMIIKPFEFVAFPYVIPIPIVFVAMVMIVSNLIFLASPPEGSNISFAAHVGGFVVGLFFGFKEKGMKNSLAILALAIVLFLLASKYIGILSMFDYTGFIDRAAS